MEANKLRSHDVVDSAYQDLKDALNAVVLGMAIPEAYSVIERFGYHELFPGCIYREENWVEVTVAREIITRAKKDDVYDGPMPEDDATAITEAESLVEMAEQAYAKHIRGPEVEAILKLAAGQNGDEPEAEGEAEESGDEHAPPETDEGKRTLRVVERLSKMEPWEGYTDNTVKDVTEGINYFMEESPGDILDVLDHVYSFETAHKNRARILSHVQEAYEKSGGSIGQEEPQEGEEAESEAESGEEPVEEEEKSTADVGSEGEELPPPTEGEAEKPDAESHTELEASEEDGKEQAAEEKPPEQNQRKRREGSPSAYQKLVSGVENELKRERLDMPTPPEEKAPELPWNWNEISDGDLHELHMRYAVCAYYKGYRLALHERIAQHCKEAADALHSERMVSIEKYDEKGKEKKVGLIEAEIASDENIKKWHVIQRKHEQLAAADKRELEAYQKIVDALSRLETMRHNAWERARR